MNSDLLIFKFLNGFSHRWELLDSFIIFCAVYLGYLLILSLALFLFKDIKKYWRMVAESLLAALIVRFVLVGIFYYFHFRARPFAQTDVNLLIPYDGGRTSFPSGHASFYFALSTIIYGYNKKAGIIFYAASLIIAVSRVFAGVHWPSDVLAGAVFGIVMGFFLNKLFKKIKIKKSPA